MKKVQSEKVIENILACFLYDLEGNCYWCIYHSDDGGEKLIFTKNISEILKTEDFIGFTKEEIINHLNKYGFEIESEEDYGDVIFYNYLPDSFTLKLKRIELITTTIMEIKD
ncbi:hypothetical protein GW796_07980 [archaeon]|nr:hypothetical protein [archaeon]